MGIVKTWNKWANAHTYYPLDLIRIALGVFLFFKGLHFMSNSMILIDLISPLRGWAGLMLIIHYVAPAHIIGGILIAFGLLTRWSVMAQMPILLGAIFINFFGVLNTSNLILAIAVFIGCLFFLVYGSGKHSADYYFKMQQ